MKLDISKVTEAAVLAAGKPETSSGLFSFVYAKETFHGYKSTTAGPDGESVHCGTTWFPTTVARAIELGLAPDENSICAAALRADGARKNKEKSGPQKIGQPNEGKDSKAVQAFRATLEAAKLPASQVATMVAAFKAKMKVKPTDAKE